MADRIRVVLAESGPDGDDRGVTVIARALRDAGMEVVYTALHQTPEQIVRTVIQEDANAIGLSIPPSPHTIGSPSTSPHRTLFRRIVELLAESDASDVVLFAAGTGPVEDIAGLEEMGVATIFPSDATMDEIVDWVRATVAPQSVG